MMYLNIHEVSKQYEPKRFALQDVSLFLQPGVIGLVGPNGAGKTTLLTMLATLNRPTRGTVTWNGVDIYKQPILWIVMRQEFLLLVRGRVIWVIGSIIALLGVMEALGARTYLLGIWNNVLTNTFLVTLLLTLASGEQAYMDHECGMEHLIWSTPVDTLIYLCGKYLSCISVALGFIFSHLLLAIIFDQFYPALPALPGMLGAMYPGLGAEAYLIWSIWYILAPTLFGTALAFAITTITRGQRVISHVLAVILWLSAYLGGLPVWLDVVGSSFFTSNTKLPGLNAATMLLASLGPHPHPTLAQRRQMVSQIRLDLPPTFLPWSFAQSRLLLVGIGGALLCLTLLLVRYRRTNTSDQKR